jgi:hypothetical protein
MKRSFEVYFFLEWSLVFFLFLGFRRERIFFNIEPFYFAASRTQRLDASLLERYTLLSAANRGLLDFGSKDARS